MTVVSPDFVKDATTLGLTYSPYTLLLLMSRGGRGGIQNPRI
jgi:hypothetical protein